ncbi:regulatory protein GemA [Parvibaculum sp.]|uniref:regulatory protein GemA n=1 Tax=Parvibaculum sp. TaxID=2024848 RepID=UPI0027323F2C|nr:regulatory protein GemA [Parvibaculum sp.]MDP3329401.1 regulatory protein GemA [Parvibaculum sp.]
MQAAPDLRKKLYAKLHIAKKQLGLDDDAWRDLLERVTGDRSLKVLDDTQLKGLVEECRRLGFKPAKQSKPLAGGREIRKARALWLSLWHLGVIPDPSEEALAGFARRVTGGKELGLAALQWVRGDDAFALIEALKERAARDAGVDWSPYRQGKRVVSHNPRARVIEAQRRILKQAGDSCPWVDIHKLSAVKADALIAELGEKIRTIRGAGADVRD